MRGKWTQAKLENSISLNALKPVGDTQVDIETGEGANIRGHNVNITVGGGVGSLASTITINLPLTSDLSDDAKIALAAAEHEDLAFFSGLNGTGTELDGYLALLKKEMWRPTGLDVFVMDRDGRNLRQVTKGIGGANWAPFFSPDGKKIIFATNFKEPRGPNFDLYLINIDGSGLEQVTFSDKFDGFPMFSPDGKKLVFASNRHSDKETDTNLFIADWVW